MKIKTLGPVELDGKKIEIGATIDLPKPAAEELIAAGAAEVLDQKAAAKAKLGADADAGDQPAA